MPYFYLIFSDILVGMRLSKLEKQAYMALVNLEYQANITKLYQSKSKKVVIRTNEFKENPFGKDFVFFRESTELYYVAEYLKNKGLNFKITFDLVNDTPLPPHYSASNSWPELGFIKDKSIDVIQEKIENLILELKSKAESGNSNQKQIKKVLNNSKKIEQLDLKENEREGMAITFFINTEYLKPYKGNKGKYWTEMYCLARDGYVDNSKGFYDYFNSNKKNPLYTQSGFNVTQILRKDSDKIIPNIKIELITQNKITRKLKKA